MNEKDFKEYLTSYGRKNNGEKISDGSIATFMSNIKKAIPNFLEITSLFEYTNIDEVNDFYQKIIDSTFDTKKHRNPSNALKHYPRFLQYKKLKETMLVFNQNPEKFRLNGASYFFKIDDFDGRYPIKAICKNMQDILNLQDDFSTDDAKLKLIKIFRNGSITFIDTIDNINEVDNIQNKGDSNMIKNIILYGSPGVGKTHNTKKLISLIESGVSEKEIFQVIKNNELNNGVDIDNIKDRVKFITFHQSFGYEDFIEGFRPNEEGKIELRDGVFKNICDEAQKNLYNSKSEKNFDTALFLNDFIQHIVDNDNFTIDNNLTLSVNKKVNGDFQSFKVGGRVQNQSLTYDIIQRDFEDFLEKKIMYYQDVKPTYESKSSYHGNAPYYFKLYQAMKKYLDTNSSSYMSKREELKNYYLVIDEINRGNISKIFGELITLIEEDKRDTLEVTLPYSKKPFKIPSNLYIIGTMNSTDKSIALIDIALRRRFTFLKMKPNIELVDNIKAKNIMKQLNENITETLGADYVLGHSYFMKIENNDDLEFVLEYKIKPLLEEYFYGDEQGLMDVMKIVKDDNV